MHNVSKCCLGGRTTFLTEGHAFFQTAVSTLTSWQIGISRVFGKFQCLDKIGNSTIVSSSLDAKGSSIIKLLRDEERRSGCVVGHIHGEREVVSRSRENCDPFWRVVAFGNTICFHDLAKRIETMFYDCLSCPIL